MKRILIVILILIVPFFIPINVFADDTLGADELYEAVPDESQTILDNLNIKNVEDTFNISIQDVFDTLSEIFQNTYLQPFKSLFLSLSIIIIVSFVSAVSDENSKLCELAGAITICTIYLPNTANIISNADSIIDAINVFLASSLPIYAVLQIAGGYPTLGSSVTAIVVFTANLFTVLGKYLIIPCLSVFLGLSVSSAFSHVNIKSICETIYSFIKGVLVLSITIFASVISIQSTLSGATDAATTKTIKLLASSAVPIVGKAFGEGVVAVQNSIKVLKSGAGAFGIIASVAIFISPVIEILLWIASCQLAIISAELFAYKKVSDILSVIMIVLKILLAVIISLCIISMVTSAITLFFGA